MPQNNNDMKTMQMANAALLPEVARLVSEGHSVTLPLRGVSMRPFLEDRRDKAVLTAPSTLSKGDVVLAEIAPGRYVLHRIVAITHDRITLLGDGNITTESCRRADIKAVAAGFMRKGRKRMDSTKGAKWRLYSAAWMLLRPARRYLLYIHRHIFTKKQA